jgi:oxygen-independent coproporphyrinogen III oxidase
MFSAQTSPTQSAGLYVHIPFCRSKCAYCGFYSLPIADHDIRAFSLSLLKELDCRLHGKIDTIYIGGGTPSSLPASELVFLLKEIINRTGPVREFTVEANPADVNEKFQAALRENHVSRLSIGAQSFSSKALQTLERRHTTGHIYQACEQAALAGFENISLDLIFAVPGQALTEWTDTLQRTIALKPKHISVYALSYDPGSRFHSMLEQGRIVPTDQETDRAMYELAIEKLTAAGFHHYEISNFAAKGFACAHNIKYWQSEPWLGIGPSAGSFYQGKRITNITDLDQYLTNIAQTGSAIEESFEPADKILACEIAVLMLRMTKGINLEKFQHKTGHDATRLFSKAITKHRRTSMIKLTAHHLKLAPKAYPVADSILVDFVIV